MQQGWGLFPNRCDKSDEVSELHALHIGETGRVLTARMKEHLASKRWGSSVSALKKRRHDHHNGMTLTSCTKYSYKPEVAYKSETSARKVLLAFWLSVRNPRMNNRNECLFENLVHMLPPSVLPTLLKITCRWRTCSERWPEAANVIDVVTISLWSITDLLTFCMFVYFISYPYLQLYIRAIFSHFRVLLDKRNLLRIVAICGIKNQKTKKKSKESKLMSVPRNFTWLSTTYGNFFSRKGLWWKWRLHEWAGRTMAKSVWSEKQLLRETIQQLRRLMVLGWKGEINFPLGYTYLCWLI